jgi:hypothetical protein
VFSYEQELLGRCEKFVCQLYNQPNTTEVNNPRLHLFRLAALFNEESMPCTKDMLLQHLSCANYQAAIWRRASLLRRGLHEVSSERKVSAQGVMGRAK